VGTALALLPTAMNKNNVKRRAAVIIIAAFLAGIGKK
jgi:hypothetical protein